MYDSEKDILIEKIGKVKIDGEGRQSYVTIGLYSYDESPPKVGLSRIYVNRTGRKAMGRLGRLSIEEAYQISKKIMRYIKEKRETGEFEIPTPQNK